MTDIAPDARRIWRQVALFLVLTLAFSSIFYAFIIVTGHAGGGRGAYAAGLMWAPGLAALATCRLSGAPLASLGWRWGAWKWQWLAYLIPLGYAALAYGLAWATGLGDFDDSGLVAMIRARMGWPSAPQTLVLVGWFLLLATTGMVGGAARALGEEIGWRGFLTPRLVGLLGFRWGAILTGLIWAAWHLPVLLLADYNNGTPWWYGMGCFTVLVVSMAVIMAWLRMRSGSLWTGAIMHASHNLFIQAIFTPATRAHGAVTAYAIDEFGFVVPALALAIAIVVAVLVSRRGLDEAGPLAA